jgi:VCBS repeat-containing protein
MIIILLSAFSSLEATGGTVTPIFSFVGGKGTVEDPFLIENIWDLQNMSFDLKSHYALINDINASITRDWNNGSGFKPLGDSMNYFTGSLDGRGLNVTGLFINRTSGPTWGVGMFGYVPPKGKVLNVNLILANISGNSSVGAIAGANAGLISNCSATGIVRGYENVGGILGGNTYDGGYVIKSNCTCTVIGNSMVGGVVGSNNYWISDSCSAGKVIGIDMVGGVAGFNRGTIRNCFFKGEIDGGSRYGGLVGFFSYGSIQNSFYDVDEVKIDSKYLITIGGIYHNMYEDWIANGLTLSIADYSPYLIPNGPYYEISDIEGLKSMLGFCYDPDIIFSLKADIDLKDHKEFYIPYIRNKEFLGNNHSINNLSLNYPDQSFMGMVGFLHSGSKISDLCLTNATIIGLDFLGGVCGISYGNIEGSQVILGRIKGRDFVGGIAGGAYGISGSDIIFPRSNSEWNHDPQYINIKNSYVSCDVIGSSYVGGICGDMDNGQLYNLSFDGSVTGGNFVGGLMGSASGYAYSCKTNCTVEGMNKVGGAIGENYAWLYDVESYGIVKGRNQVGGLAGFNTGEVQYCSSEAIVEGYDGVGGLVGRNYMRIVQSKVSCHVTGGNRTGGLVGQNNGTVESSYSEGVVSGRIDVGGLVGVQFPNNIITHSRSNCSVKGDESVGGLIGGNKYGGKVRSSYANGTVFGIMNVGGFAGANYGGALISRSYSTSVVSGEKFLAGFGNGIGSVEDCFWDVDIFEVTNGSKGFARNTIEMQKMSTYVEHGWDFDETWWLFENSTYPFFQWERPDPYPISDVRDLQNINHNLDGRYFINNDIDANRSRIWNDGMGFKPLGNDTNPFVGILDGRSRRIIDLYECSPQGAGGLFGHIGKNALVTNIDIIRANITAGSITGSIAGMNAGTIVNVNISGIVLGADNTGGLAGFNNGTIIGSKVSGSVFGLNATGGLIGENSGILILSFSTCRVEGMEKTGGMVGSNMRKIEDSYSNGDVIGSHFTGGFVGYNNGDINRTYSTGRVTTGDRLFGGLIGYSSSKESFLDSFWDIETSTKAMSMGGNGLKTDMMMDESPYLDAGWDFDNIWAIKVSHSYPFFRWDYENDPPCAVDDRYEVKGDTLLCVGFPGILGNDYDSDAQIINPDLCVDSIKIWKFDRSSKLGAKVTVLSNGSFHYDPSGLDSMTFLGNNESLIDSFGYEIMDLFSNRDNGTVYIDISGVNEDPDAYDVLFGTDEDKVLNISAPGLLLFTSDKDKNDELSINPDISITTSGAVVNILSNGSLLYDPRESERIQSLSEDDVLYDDFTYTVIDGLNSRDIGAVRIEVEGVNDLPKIVTDSSTKAKEDELYEVEYEALDPDDRDLRWTMTTNAPFLSMAESTGILSGIPENDDVGTWDVQISVFDGKGHDSIIFKLTVFDENDPPVLVIPEIVIMEDSLERIQVDGLFRDIDDDELRFFLSPIPVQNVAWSLDGSTLIVEPNKDWSGKEELKMKCDDGTVVINATITLIVENTNDRPCGLSLNYDEEYRETEPQFVNASAIDVDLPYGDTLNFTWKVGERILGYGERIDLGLTNGGYKVNLTVTDSKGESATKEFFVTIKRWPGGDEPPFLIFIIIGFVTIIACTIIIYKVKRTERTFGPPE